jgi:hypothetical protein
MIQAALLSVRHGLARKAGRRTARRTKRPLNNFMDRRVFSVRVCGIRDRKNDARLQRMKLENTANTWGAHMAEHKVSAKAVAADIRSGKSKPELMEKHGLSARGLEFVLQKLIENQVVTASDVSGVRHAPSATGGPEGRESPVEPQRTTSGQPIDPKLAVAIVEDVRRGRHDYDIMLRFRLSRDELREIMVTLVRLGDLSSEEIEARKFHKIMQCPHCRGQVFEDADKCKHCGRDLIQTSSSATPTGSGVEGKRTAPRNVPSDQGCAWDDYWENRGSRGLLKAYFRTVKQCLASPANFFSNLPSDLGYWAPTLFGAISIAVPITFYVVLVQCLKGAAATRGLGWLIFLSAFALLGALVFASICLLLASLLIHGFLMLLGGARSGFQATFRALSYSQLTSLFCVIPLLGHLVGNLWGLYLSGVGLRQMHGTSTAKAFSVVLIPVLVVLAAVVTLGAWPGSPIDSRAASSARKPTISTPLTGQALPSDAPVLRPTGFKTDADEFSVITPAPLLERKVVANSVLGKIHVLVFSAQEGDVAYSIICAPDLTPSYFRFLRYLPSSPFVPAPDPEKMLDTYRDNMVRGFNGKLVSETRVVLDENPGREIVIEGAEKPGHNVVMKGRAFAIKHSLHQIMVVAPNEELCNTPAVNAIFESFTLRPK